MSCASCKHEDSFIKNYYCEKCYSSVYAKLERMKKENEEMKNKVKEMGTLLNEAYSRIENIKQEKLF
jgi:predicted nuclease with TOPRIM domain